MNRKDDLTRKFEKLHIPTTAETDDRILEDAFAELDESRQQEMSGIGQGVCQRTRRKRIAEFVAVVVGIVVIFVVFFGMPSAKAVSLAMIYQAVEKAGNICVSRFDVGDEESTWDTYISNSLRIRLNTSDRDSTLTDLNNWTRKEISRVTESESESVIQIDSRKDIENSLSDSFGLVPFSKQSDVPHNSHWEKVADEKINTSIPNTEIYDLTWIGIHNELSTHYKKWRVFVDINTGLPVRIEWYRKIVNKKMKSDDDYLLQGFNVVTYPTEAEILAVIEKTFGPEERRRIEAENVGKLDIKQLNTDSNQ